MAILISAREITKSFAHRPLFSEISFAVDSGDRIGLIGPNGAGKSTLLKILAGVLDADSGEVTRKRGLRVAFLQQIPQFKPEATILSAILEGALEPEEWEAVAKSQELISKLFSDTTLGLHEGSLVETLSGGWKKRVAIARELMRDPELFLLDEPTNHLDIDAIFWLEEFLATAPFATITITHDRAFLQKVSNRILDLDRRNPSGLLSINGDYAHYLESKEILIAGQLSSEERLKNTLRRETEWLRRGAKARTTKQQARIDRAHDLRETVDELSDRNRNDSVRFDFQGLDRNPKKLVEAEDISFRISGRTIVPNTSLIITPKTRLGLMGSNGCGKSTLIKLLVGELEGTTGSVKRAENLKVTYFSQNREISDPDISVLKTICPVGDFVDFAGQHVHVRSYLQRFLFSDGQVDLPVGRLSGGEQARLLLAQLMLREANLLVLDEPTNDLDMATLDLLGDVLKDFAGAVVLVTHDRYFMDHVATQVLGFFDDGGGEKKIISFSGLDQWKDHYDRWRQEKRARQSAELKAERAKSSPAGSGPTQKKRRSFKEEREFQGMEEAIHAAEAKLAELEAQSVAPENSSNSSKLLEIAHAIEETRAEVERLYARWAELEI